MSFIGNNPKWNTGGFTELSADPVSPTEGMVFRSDGTSRGKGLWEFQDGDWQEVGGQGGSLDLILTENFDGAANADSFTTGQSAVFGASGTIGGALTDEEATPIQGRRSITFTTSTVANDWFHVDAIAMGEKQQGNVISCIVYAKWNGTLDELKFKAFDATNTVDLESVSIDTSDTLKRYSLQFFVPTNCTSIKVGFQHLGTTGSQVLEFDDLQITQDPFAVAEVQNIGDWVEFTPTFSSGFGSITNESARWRRVGDTMEVTGFLTAPSTTGTAAEINLPSGFLVDATKLNTNDGRNFVGAWHRIDAGTRFYSTTGGSMIHADIVNLDRVLIARDSLNNTTIRPDIVTNIISNTESATYRFVVPIQGWTSSTENTIVANAAFANSMIRVNTGNGHGATNTKIRRMSNVIDSLGTAITRASSAADGDSYTINETGEYKITYQDSGATASDIGLSLNGSELTTDIDVITEDDKLSVASFGINQKNIATWSGILNENDVIRPHTDGVPDGTTGTNSVSFTIAKIGTTQLTGVPIVKETVGLNDGVSIPATIAGLGQIFIDTADGDLKIKFGDGTVKTIVVDT